MQSSGDQQSSRLLGQFCGALIAANCISAAKWFFLHGRFSGSRNQPAKSIAILL
jgi:hypothetical protein